MGGNEMLYIILIIIFIMLSAFFSASETAFLSLQRVRLEHLVSSNVRGAKRVARMVEKPEKLLSVVLLGNNLVNVAAAALVTALALSLWGEQGIIIATIVITMVILIFAETTPKTFAAQHAEKMAVFIARPLQAIAWLLTPFVAALSWIAAGFARLLGGQPAARTLASPEEIITMIAVGKEEGTVEAAEAELLHKVFEFGDRPAHEVMVPRPDVIAIEQGSTVAGVLSVYAEKPMSRFPVYVENMDNVVGIIAMKDILMALAKDPAAETASIEEMVRPAYFAPETKMINQLFFEMRDNNFRMAVIVDEYGGTSGIISLSRLVEEIVGEVGDEFSDVEKDYEVINDYTFQIDGGMRIDEANQEMELNLPEGEDYETVAGFILSLLGHIPRRNEQLRYHGMKIVITEMKGMKIDKILLTRERQAAEEKEGRQQEAPAKSRKKPGRQFPG